LFDLDRTLIESGGAGRAALRRAFAEVCGFSDDLATVGHDGKTDRHTVQRILVAHGHGLGAFDPVRDRYFVHLEDELKRREGMVLPGVVALLAALSDRPDTAIGLATGNFRKGAMQKLRRYRLDSWLPDGGYGDIHLERTDVVREGIEKLRSALEGVPRVVVFGDTPHDMEAALATGAIAIGVATGSHSADSLEKAGASRVFVNLGEVEAVLEAIEA
jgi:phosphoglycolate phosphatase-like HAD superfamily hydrolase